MIFYNTLILIPRSPSEIGVEVSPPSQWLLLGDFNKDLEWECCREIFSFFLLFFSKTVGLAVVTSSTKIGLRWQKLVLLESYLVEHHLPLQSDSPYRNPSCSALTIQKIFPLLCCRCHYFYNEKQNSAWLKIPIQVKMQNYFLPLNSLVEWENKYTPRSFWVGNFLENPSKTKNVFISSMDFCQDFILTRLLI